MKKFWVSLFCVTALVALASAQSMIPAGTLIPVRLNSALSGGRASAGQTISAMVAQDVPLDNGSKISRGAHVTGEVLASTPTTMTIRFDKVSVNGQMMPILTNLRAMASPLDVESAQTQISGDERGSVPAWSQTVPLIGGNDVAYREQGTVDDGLEPVGKPVWAGDWGVVNQVASRPGEPCRGAVAGNTTPQPMWVFAHDACGVFGYDIQIADAGRGNPQGKIALQAAPGDLNLYKGTALLLRVDASGQQVQAAAQ
ncbi:MAG TPA: hypothetical protein VMT82_01690 [candidate division Zixibacteria bacterium]|nr:hypothetical protein [candidate division Zixibacteria bacterium]